MKISCPICFEQIDVDGIDARSIPKCPTCNNALPAAEAIESLEVRTPIAEPRSRVATSSRSASSSRVASSQRERAPRPATDHDRRVSPSSTLEAPREDPNTKKFSFRIFGLSLLLTLLIIVSALIVALSVLFAVKTVDSEIVLGFRDVFFDRLGITDPSQYDTRKIAFVVGQFGLPMIFGIMALVAVARRKRVFVGLLLVILAGIGLVTEAPAILAIPVLCLFLVLLPGRSPIWRKSGAQQS